MSPQGHFPATNFRASLLAIMLLIASTLRAQITTAPQDNKFVKPFTPLTSHIPYLPVENDQQLFGTGSRFIENIGQYGDTLAGVPNSGRILYAFEGFGMPVLFTTRGMIYLQRRINKLSEKEREEAERSGALNKEVKEGLYYTDRRISVDWVNANVQPDIVAEDVASHYYTFACVKGKAKGYSRIIYKNIYPGIDLMYTIKKDNNPGFEYSFIVKPGADPAVIKMFFHGDIKEMSEDEDGALLVNSDVDGIRHSNPLSFYPNDKAKGSSEVAQNIKVAFNRKGRVLSFKFPEGYDSSREIIIDPFVTATNSLTGTNAGIAKDIDFDYAGNIYVTGGGSTVLNMLAKFNSNGNLLWTFNGTLSTPAWTFGYNYGGWVVEKITGKVYLGQGGTGGFQIIRLTTDGVYDNFITAVDPALQENWKMIWNCDGGTPKILIAGGGSANEHINLAICTPPSTALTQINITGQPAGHQDVADLVLDPRTNDLYTLFAQGFTTPITENNRLYKHQSPYTPAVIKWHRLTGFPVLNERANRPYLADGSGFNDNSINGLAVNSSYIFYADGHNLAAMNKTNGNTVGTPIVYTFNPPLHQGGIVADECNNVYVGSISGTIKVYQFNGSTFNDGAAADISIAGFGTSAVYDLAYDNGKNMLYACGKGFVAAINIANYCETLIYKLEVEVSCNNFTVVGKISPALPAGSNITYELYEGLRLIEKNQTGIFPAVQEGHSYTMKALVNEKCGGTQAVKDFTVNSCIPPGIGTGVFVPTGFTPNGDGLNDILYAVPYGIREFKSFTLYNRWGEIVFKTSDPAKGWDGTINGKSQQSAVFVYTVEAIDVYGEPVKLKGTTTLIR